MASKYFHKKLIFRDIFAKNGFKGEIFVGFLRARVMHLLEISAKLCWF
jgi:hypothetical protein